MNIKDKQIVWKRIQSALADIFIALTPALLVRSRFPDPDFGFIFSLMFGLLFVCCIAPLIDEGRTVGDMLTKIRLVSVNDTPVPYAKAFLRNLSYIVFVCLFWVERDNAIEFAVSAVTFLSIYSHVFFNEGKDSQHMSALDIVFKTKYTFDGQPSGTTPS